MKSKLYVIGPALVPMLVSLSSAAGADTYLVKPDGTGDFPTIQSAIDAAADSDVIELSDGVFTGPGNRDIDYLGKAVTVRSQGGIPDLCIIDCEGSESDEHRGFYFHSDEGEESVLEGVTIKSGYIVTGEWPLSRGGAVLCRGASPTFRSVIFEENTGRGAGALLCVGAGSVTVSDCVFVGNRALEGAGALGCNGTTLLRIEDCEFYDNSAEFGGAIFSDFCSLEIERCIFARNSAIVGGAWVSSTFSSGTLSHCTLWSNSAKVGAAISVSSGLNLVNTIVAFNTGGEAINCTGLGAELTCCDIYGNEGGDWTDCIADQIGENGNISLDPLFCDPDADDLTLHVGSPCAPEYNPECGLIGARPVGCEPPIAVEQTTWGQIKERFTGSGGKSARRW